MFSRHHLFEDFLWNSDGMGEIVGIEQKNADSGFVEQVVEDKLYAHIPPPQIVLVSIEEIIVGKLFARITEKPAVPDGTGMCVIQKHIGMPRLIRRAGIEDRELQILFISLLQQTSEPDRFVFQRCLAVRYLIGKTVELRIGHSLSLRIINFVFLAPLDSHLSIAVIPPLVPVIIQPHVDHGILKTAEGSPSVHDPVEMRTRF